MPLDLDGDAVHVTVDGTRYRVHDAAFGPPLATPGHYKLISLESPKANTRYFVDAFKTVRGYSFKRSEPRAITEEALLAQLHASGFVGQTPRDRGALRPT